MIRRGRIVLPRSVTAGDGPFAVAPAPKLREEIRRNFTALRDSAPPHLASLLRIKGRTSPGLNDGLIYPGNLYPITTPLAAVRRAAADRAPLQGTIRAIVVLVQFSDRAMNQTAQHFKDLFFSTGVLTNGSVREYYREVSNNVVDVIGEVAGPYQLPKTLAEYAHGESGIGSALPNARTMALDAATAANPDVDFAPYDNDADGYVDAFIVIHAGPGAEATGRAGDIWSHKWVLPGGAYNADGTQIYAYVTVPEDAAIGVCAHELGHLLFGFIDLYDTDYSSEGVGDWCLMGTGSWNGNNGDGEVPAHPCAYLKASQGWVTINTPTQNSMATINEVESSREIYKLLPNGVVGNDYFMVENRQRKLFDRALPGDGLLIWHIDESISSNSDENHPKVALEQADAKQDLLLGNNRGDAGDPFPGSTNNTAFSGSTTPNSNSYGGAATCVSVTQISASGPAMTAYVAVKCPVGPRPPKQIKDMIDNFKQLRDSKLFKDSKDLKDHKPKEPDKPVKEKDKDWEKPADWPGGGGGWSPQEVSEPGSLEARVAALEAALAAIQPFIGEALRPDLRTSALAAEAPSKPEPGEKRRAQARTKSKRSSTR